MDGTAFDRLARGFGAAGNRRTALKGLAGAVLGLGIGRGAAAQVEEQARSGCGGDCRDTRDCREGLQCDRPGRDSGRCVAKPDSGASCRVDSNCPTSEECRGFRCVNRVTCRGGCRSDRDCRGDEVCRNGRCETARCSRDAECRRDEVCRSNRCVRDERCGNAGDRCQRKRDCCEGLACDRRRGRCGR